MCANSPITATLETLLAFQVSSVQTKCNIISSLSKIKQDQLAKMIPSVWITALASLHIKSWLLSQSQGEAENAS